MPQALPDDLSWRLMETMLTVRRFEEAVLRLSNEGDSLWKLPVLFLCENNSGGSWAPGEGYPTLVHASSDLRSIAQSLGIKTLRVDGADVAQVHAAASDAAAQCRSGKGPVFIEAMTRRWPGSNPLWPEPVTGVTDLRMATDELAIEGEHRDWLEHHDPVLRFGRGLAAAGAAARTHLYALDAATRARIENAVEFARAAPLPVAKSAFEHVFA
jgi:TPP-dependent pyruvate/acetoin dehydrogenase alpha subunit